MFSTWKRLPQLTVCPPACNRRQSGLREDNVLKLHYTQFSQRGQPVWKARPALPQALCWRRWSCLLLPRLMWTWSQQRGRGLILLFILNRLSASLTVPFKQAKKGRRIRMEADFTVLPEIFRVAHVATSRHTLICPYVAMDTVTHKQSRLALVCHCSCSTFIYLYCSTPI